jgi:hypothetical protein
MVLEWVQKVRVRTVPESPYTHNFKTNWDTLNGYNSIMSRAILMKFFSK